MAMFVVGSTRDWDCKTASPGVEALSDRVQPPQTGQPKERDENEYDEEEPGESRWLRQERHDAAKRHKRETERR